MENVPVHCSMTHTELRQHRFLPGVVLNEDKKEVLMVQDKQKVSTELNVLQYLQKKTPSHVCVCLGELVGVGGVWGCGREITRMEKYIKRQIILKAGKYDLKDFQAQF